ncbi:MAG: TetR/AcrR family transcriptional regulator [Eggerthella lenta]
MARPRKDQEGHRRRAHGGGVLEILAEKPYAQITVGEIAKRAQVNKNAFYYHFDGLGALAARALDSMLPREMARMLLMNGERLRKASTRSRRTPCCATPT